MQRNYRRALRGALLASVSILGAGLSQAFSAVTDYPDGSTNSSPIVLTDNTRQLQVLTGSAIQSGVISESGGSFGFEKIGNGTLILTGANTYTGGTTIGAGTLALSGVGKFGAGVINDNAALQILTTEALSNAIVFGASSDSRISAAAGTVLSLTGDLTFNTVAGRTLYFGSSTDTGTIAVASGNVTIGANAGALEIAGGTLKDISTTVPQSNFATALGKFSSVTIDSGATLEIDSNGNGRASNTETFIKLFGGGQLVMGGNSLPRVVLGSSNFSGKISGAGYVGIGPLDASLPHDTIVLTGNGNNAVEFQIGTGSTLQVGDGGTTGSLANGGRVVGYTDSRYGSAVLKYARSDNVTLGRFLLGSLVLQQAGSGILTVSTNNTNGDTSPFYGSVTVSSGGLSISNDNNLNGAPVSLSSATTLYTTASGIYTSTITITGSSTFNIADGTTTVWSGQIANGTSSGALNLAGGGNLTLTGANTYTGGTTISAGTLQIGNGSSGGSVAGNIIDNAALIFNRSDNITFSGVISGNGSVTKLGNGVLTLGDANSYAGGTTISAGLVNFATLGNFGAGNITLNSGGLQWASGSTVDVSTRLNALGSGGGTFDTNGNTVTLAGVITGTGGLTKAGLGTLILMSANTYSGVTTISAGTLQLGTGSANGSVAGNVTDDGTFVFNRSDAFSFAGVISGAGAVTQAGAGTLILTGANTYTGGTTISAGTLQIGNGGSVGSITGNVVNNGALVFNSDSTLAYAGVVSGTGSLAKSGTGILILTGANTYAGGTAINAGTLQIGSGGATGSIGGNVADNGVLAFNRSDTVSFAGVISGSGSLEQAGTGTLTLGGANTYTGGTIVSAGTLRIGSGGALASAGALIVNGGTFELNGAVQSVGTLSGTSGSILLGSGVLTTSSDSDTTLASVIGGAGAFAKAGSGVLTLAATNTYTGATSVTSGALNVTGSIASSSGVTVASGAALTGTGTVSSTTVQSGGTLSAGGASVGTLNVSGDLTLNSGAITQVNVTTTAADKLVVSGAAAIDGMLNVAFAGGSYVPTQYTIITSTGALSGTFSSLNLTGAPSGLATGLVYDANNVFLKLVTGFSANANFNIDAGTVNVNGNQTTGGISGTGGTINIAGATLTNNQTGASTFAGAFAGSGVFTETGSGTLILNGNSSGFAGTTTVGGSLEVGDAAHPGASLGGTVNVSQGGTLGGHGTVSGSVTNAGVTAPGGSIGTLTVAGNYSFASGASLQQEVAANGAADLLKVGGAVSIAGNTTLQVLAADPVSSYARVTNYTVVTGAGGISGSFTNVTSTAGLTSIVSYAPGAVNLTVVRNDISLATLATTANQAGVGAAISADPGSALFAAVAPLGNAQMPSVLASLSGEIHASVRSAAIEDGRILRQSVLDELAADPQGAAAVWGSLFASSGHIDSDGNAASVNHTNGGGIVGIDTMLGGGLRAGVAGAYSSRSVSAADRASHASGTSGHVLAYAGWSDAALHLRAGVDFGWGGDDILRNVGQLGEANASHQNLSTTQIFGEAGYSFQTGLGALEPYAQIAWLEARSGNFAETGGALSSLRGRAASNAVAYGGFGLRARFRAVDLGDGMNLTPHLELGLQHAFNTFLPSQTLLVGAGSFLASGVSLPGDAATVGAGIDLALSPAARLSIGYDGALASQAQNHAVRAQIRWALQ